MITTRHVQIKAVLQDLVVYERDEENLAILKVLAQSPSNIKKAQIKPARKEFIDI